MNYLKETELQENTKDSPTKSKDVKTIVIDKDSGKNLKRFTKNKSKNFRFFD